MRMLRPLLLLGLLCQTTSTNAQSISGRVTGENGTPLPGVNVAVIRTSTGAVTGSDGRYLISPVAPDTFTVVFSHVGYRTERRLADARADDAELDVVLYESLFDLGEVTVEQDRAGEALRRAAQSVTVLTAAELDDVRGQTLGETIDHLPGVTSLSTGPTIQKPVIRGLHSERVLIISKGLRQEGQQWGAEHAPEIDPFAANGIEVVRGAAGVEYGAGAIGGVIRLTDNPLPYEPGFDGQASLFAHSNSAQGAVSVTAEGSSDRLPGVGFRARTSIRRAGDARTPDYVLNNTAFFERNYEANVGYLDGPLELSASVNRFTTDLGIYSGSHFNTFGALDTVLALGRPPVDYTFSYDIGAPKQSVSHDVASASAHLDLGGGAHADVRYGLQRNRRREYDADRIAGRDPLERPAFDLTLTTHALELRAQSRPVHRAGGDAFGVVGLSGMTQGNRGSIGYLIPNFRVNTAGAFAHGNWVSGPWTVESGTRVDLRRVTAYPKESRGQGDFIHEVNSWAGVSAVVGAIRQLGSTWSIASNVSAAWRPPSINELYSFGVHHGSAQFEIGNDELGTERSLTADLVVRSQTPSTQLEFSLFANRIADYVYLDPTGEIVVTIRGVYPTFEYAQTTALLRGVDGSLTQRLGRGFEIDLTGSLIRGDDRGRDEPLLAIPADRVGATSRYELPDARFTRNTTLEAGVQRVARQSRFPTRVGDDGHEVPIDYTAPPAGYTVVAASVATDLRIGLTRVRVSISAENLLNAGYRDYLSRYRYFAHDPGRNVMFRMQIPFGRLSLAG